MKTFLMEFKFCAVTGNRTPERVLMNGIERIIVSDLCHSSYACYHYTITAFVPRTGIEPARPSQATDA